MSPAAYALIGLLALVAWVLFCVGIGSVFASEDDTRALPWPLRVTYDFASWLAALIQRVR